jgi:hypothetical protein
VPFHDGHLHTGAGEQHGGGQAARARTYDNDALASTITLLGLQHSQEKVLPQ